VPATKRLGTERLIAWQRLPELSDAPMCQLTPAAASQTLMAALQQSGASSSAAAKADGAAPPRPSDALREEIAKRQPIATLKDTLPGYAGIAVDPVRNEVVMADENLFSIHVFDRMENTPPTAKMSEPKRMIHGENTFLEFTCSVYVDPATGEIYGINNDTLTWMPVFGRDAKGNATPIRKLAAPMTAFGIVADETTQELFITVQDDHAVAVFSKTAKEQDAAIRYIQGPHTQMADPHGVTLDPKTNRLYVTNWGTSNDRNWTDPMRVKRNMPSGRNQTIPASGRIAMPSITVYPKDATGDTAPLQVIQGPRTQLSWPTALAVHSERGELFVANDSGDSVIVFPLDANGDVAPIRVIKGPKTLVKNPTGVAVDEKNNELWVANFGTHAATVFPIDANGNATPKRVIRSGPVGAPAPMIGNPHTVAYDSKRDEVLIANCVAHPQIAAFKRLADQGHPQATRSIAGQNTNITRTIHDMAYDPIHDEIVVPQFYAFAILTFAGNADGNVAPVRRIFGPSTQIKLPDAVALDPVHGEIYVPMDDQRVLVFPREANGDMAPMRILNTGKESPNRLTIDPVHNLLIVSGGDHLRIWDRTATGDTPPKAVITIPKDFGVTAVKAAGVDALRENQGRNVSTALMATNPSSGMVFVAVRVGGRYGAEDYVGVWSVFDKGEVAPRLTVGGPGGVLKDVRGIAVDPKNKNVIISDKTLNSIMTFHVPEAF
jgi:DNA-binding beta-propeller fold protein YncE